MGLIGKILGAATNDQSWQAVLRRRIRKDSYAKDVIGFIMTGQPQGVLINTRNARPASRSAVNRGLFRNLPQKHGQEMLGVACALTPAQRQRFGELVNCRWDLDSTLTCFLDIERGKVTATVSIQDLEEAGPALGWPPGAITDALISTGRYRYRQLNRFPGFDELVRRDHQRIAAALTPAKSDHQGIWHRLEKLEPQTLQLLAPQVCDAATAAGKTIRKFGGDRLQDLPQDVAIEQLRLLATTAKPPQRANAVGLLAELAGPDGRDDLLLWATEHLENDRSELVQDAVATLRAIPVPELVRPALPPVDLPRIKVSGFTRRGFWGEDPNTTISATLNGETPASQANVRALASTLAQDNPKAAADWTSGHVARVLLPQPYELSYRAHEVVNWLRTVNCPSPLAVSAVAAIDNREEVAPVQVVSQLFAADPTLWTVDQISSWAAYHADALLGVLRNRDSVRYYNRSALLETLARVEPMPKQLQTALVEAAVDGYKADRKQLYEIVGVEHAPAILPYLKSRKRGQRAGAAEWLKAHPCAEAVDVVLEATRKEQDNGVKSTLLSVLEVNGQSLEEFLGPESLLADAKKALSKKSGIPKALSWLDVDALPSLRWADGTPVAGEIVHWFLALAVKAKTAEPSPILRRHFNNMDQPAVKAFGGALLDHWLAEDLKTMDHDSATEQARSQAPNVHQWAHQYPSSDYYAEFQNLSLQQVEDRLYQNNRQTIAGSATTSKGLLAVVAASSGAEVADRTLGYIRKHRGHRASQAKALLQMLAWIDEPATVQAVMSIAVRFRPRGIQDEALNQANLLAERHGWTLDDLADRSVPTAGFEPNGRQVFNYGDRTFTAHLGDDLTITLRNDETGKTVRSLPKGRADEDEELIKEAKRDFSASKKELKNALNLQPDRLHLAMCIQRSWGIDDFTRYFLDHPLMIRLVTRQVWVAESPGGDLIGFRPLTDGTILGPDDEEVALSPAMKISIAHEQLFDEQTRSEWMAHLADYEVEPLFAQFGRPHVAVTPDQRLIDDHRGYANNDGTLRGHMNRYAWGLGTPQDGGLVLELIKRVPTADLTAVITLEDGLPAGSYDVGSWVTAVEQLFFVPARATDFRQEDAVALAEVPPVLLTEFYAEYVAIASSGTRPDNK